MGQTDFDTLVLLMCAAGPVIYDCEGFLESNRDLLYREGVDLLLSSGSKFVKTLGTSIRGEDAPSSHGQAAHARRNSKLVPNDNRPDSPSTSKKNQAISVGAQFKKELNSLLGALAETHPHFIRSVRFFSRAGL